MHEEERRGDADVVPAPMRGRRRKRYTGRTCKSASEDEEPAHR
jgi:hypothetical protein